MKTGKSLQELALELDRQSRAKRDYIASPKNMSMRHDGESFSLLNGDIFDVTEQGGDDLTMTELFHRQLGAALNIPSKYYDKMRTEYPSLLADNVNSWLRRSRSNHLVRTLDGKARAFLSDRYRRIDNYAVAQATLPIIAEMRGAEVVSCEVTENHMYLKIVNKKLKAEVQKGDVVQAGIVISNSEVGLGSVSVMPLVYRLVCLNGMIINSLGEKKYHIGRVNGESWELYSDTTLKAEDTAFMMKLGDVVRTAVDEARFGMIVDKLKEAAGLPIKGDVTQIVELMSRHCGFNRTEENNILNHLIQGGDLSLYGLSSAVTRASQDIADYDRATELEAAGWNVITSMNPQLWAVLNNERTQ